MAPLSRAGALVAALLLAACTADELTTSSSTTSQSPARLDPAPGKLEKAGVGTLGKIVSVNPNKDADKLRHLVLYVTGLEPKGPQGQAMGHHDLPAGLREITEKHAQLQVHIDDSTKFIVHGDTLATIGDLLEDSLVVVVGQVTGSALHARVISDLTGLAAATPPAVPAAAQWRVASGPAGVRASVAPLSSSSLPSMCVGQDFAYTDPSILEFQGCWGGPSYANTWDPGFIPLFCPIFGCFGLDQVSVDGGVLGWGFAFPFQFSATAQDSLVYHQPRTVNLKIQPLADNNTLHFWGGLGFDFGMNFDYCFWKCWDLGWLYVGLPFSQMYASYGAPPLTGDSLAIKETSCPSIAIIPIEDFPLNPLELGVCTDLTAMGVPFNATVATSGASPGHYERIAFNNPGASWQVRPDAPSVGVTFNNFSWTPTLKEGLYFRLKSFMIKIFDTPSIPITSGAWGAITTPFPAPNDVFSLATASGGGLLYQPTSHTATLGVKPGKSLITITSAQALTEGVPVTAWLREQYDGSAIGGEAVTFEAQGLNGTSSVTRTGTTAADGMASVVLPIGEYTVTATFAGKSIGGSPVLFGSTDAKTPLYVYRPTTFVIWGGNTGGISAGGRYQFWGSGWWRQVTGGDYGGNASFLGYSLLPAGATLWTNPPANAGRGPATVPDVIGVIVATSVAQRGSNLYGNVAGHAILRVEEPAGYRPDGGHAAWGVVRTQLP